MQQGRKPSLSYCADLQNNSLILFIDSSGLKFCLHSSVLNPFQCWHYDWHSKPLQAKQKEAFQLF